MAGPSVLPDPERDWARASHLDAIEVDDVEKRMGPVAAPLEVLGGGRANLNVRIGADRVLRIYRRDRETATKERTLLQRPWASFVVPKVLDAGADFVVLEYVAHRPLGATADAGARVGRALAEIHQTRFTQRGFLGEDLTVRTPFEDIVVVLRSHAREEFSRATWLDASRRSAVERCLERHAGLLRDDDRPPALLHGDFKPSNLHAAAGDRLLVLDWEFAWAGPPLMDVGQLFRWSPPAPFAAAFADSYRADGGALPDGWQQAAAIVDLVNLAGLAAGAAPASRRANDLRRRIDETLQASDS